MPAHVPDRTGQPAPLEPDPEPLPPLVPPFTCIYEVKNPDVSALAMGSDGHNFVCGHESGEVALWDVRKPGQRLVAALGNGERVHSVAVSADCGRVLAGCRDGLWLWNVERGRTAGLMEHDRDDKSGQKHLNVWSVAVTPDGRYGVSGGVVEGLRVWDLEKEECVCKADSMGCMISVGISPQR